MQAELTPELAGTTEGTEAQAIVRKCVHCGFCNATCPTYQLLGDELDGPRGRIYLIKQVLEGQPATRSTQQHLDRCLTCRNCETTCPSGVEFGQLIEIGRALVDSRVERPIGERAVRWSLKEGMTSRLFAPALAAGRVLRPWLPEALRKAVPAGDADDAGRAAEVAEPPVSFAPAAGAGPASLNAALGAAPSRRKVLLAEGCVQPAMMPGIDRAAERVLRLAGIEVLKVKTACCGAVRTHLGDVEGGRGHMRDNIDAWTPLLAGGRADTVVSTASACALSIKEYGRALAHDPDYCDRAARLGALARDLSELLPEIVAALRGKVRPPAGRIAYHPPCTLQHGQQLRGGVESALRELGFDIAPAPRDAHLCCGSAGTYSLLQPKIAAELRDRKLGALQELAPAAIVSANVGCIRHLQTGTGVPVRHWIQLLDQALPSP